MEFNTTQEIIDDIADGKLVILVDDEDRENEGDLVCAAELVTPEIINFMATKGRGITIEQNILPHLQFQLRLQRVFPLEFLLPIVRIPLKLQHQRRQNHLISSSQAIYFH